MTYIQHIVFFITEKTAASQPVFIFSRRWL